MRYLQHRCTHCQTVDRIDASLVLTCPACGAVPGDPCTDLRGARFRQLAAVHRERRDALDGARVALATQMAGRAA